MIFKLLERMLHEYFEKSSAVNFPSPIRSVCVFLHAKRDYAITLWNIEIIRSIHKLTYKISRKAFLSNKLVSVT